MRKFTFFLALMVTMVTTAFAQGSEVIDIASNADAMLYSNAPCKVTTWGDDFKGWHVLFDDDASTIFHSDYSGDNSVDGLDHYLRVDMGEGNSVSLFTFTFTTRNTNSEVNSPTTIVVEGSNVADGEYTEIATLSGLPTTNSTVYTSETLGNENVSYRYIRYRVTETATNQTQGGKVFFFISEFGMTKVQAGAVKANVDYTYTFNGKVIGGASITTFVGDAYPEPTNVPFGYYAEAPAGVIEGDVAKEIECVVKLPFEAAASVDAIEKWYNVSIKATDPHYFQYFDGQESVKLVKAVAEGEENNSLWAFVGDMENGFMLVNYAAGVQKVLASADPSNDGNTGANTLPVLVNANEVPAEYTTKWFIKESPFAKDGFYVAKASVDGPCLNLRDGNLAYWTGGADNGSTVLVSEAEPIVSELEALVESKYTRNPAESALSPQNMYQLAGVKLDFPENIKKAEGVTVWGNIVDAEGNEVAVLDKIMGGTSWFATPYTSTPVTVPGTYKVVVNAGVFTNVDGTKEYKGGEYEFTVAGQPVTIIPAIDEGFFYGETFTTVEDFLSLQIRIKGATEVALTGEANITLTSGQNEYVAELTITEENGDKLVNIAFPTEEYAEGRYTVNVPAGVFTIDGTANEAFVSSSFTYSTPKLKISKDWTSWESLFTEKYMMPREVAIAINNATEVTVTEGLSATLTVGETTYNSTVEFTNEGNNYWISFQFAEIEAIYEDENADFIKGDYVLTIPAGLYTVNGEANVEETRAFTYGDAVVAEFSVKSIAPAAGTVLSLDQIALSFTNTTRPDQLIVTNEAGDRFFFISMNGAYVAVDPLADYAEAPITEAGKYTLDLSGLEGLVGKNVFTWTVNPAAVMPTEYVSSNEYVTYLLPGIKLWFDEKVKSIDLAEGETSYGYILNAAGEKVLELNKHSYISGNLMYITLTNDNMDYVEGAGDYTVVVTGTITFESGNVYNGGEFVLNVTKQPAEITMDVDLWGTMGAMPTTINITVDNVDEIVLDETQKATLTCGEDVYEAVATLEGNVITLAFPEDVEYANGKYTFLVPEGFFTYDGELSQEIWESFTYKKTEPLKILSITPAEGNVESIEKIVIEFNQEIQANWEFEMGDCVFVRTNGWGASATIEYTASVYDPSIYDYAPSPLTAEGEYVFGIEFVTEMALAEGEQAIYTWTIGAEAPVVPLEVVNITPAEPVEKLETITIEFSDEIAGTFDIMAMSQIYLGSRSNGCSYEVNGNVLTITPFYAITAAGEYALKIPAGLITRVADGSEVTMNGEIVFTVVEPLAALEVVNITPSEPVEKLETITIEFSDEIAGTFDIMAMSQIYLGSRSNGCSYEVNGNVLTITPFYAITAAGEYALKIPAGLITRVADGSEVTMNGEIVFTVVEPLAALEVVSYTPSEPVEKLETITIEFSDEIAGTFDIMAMSQIYLGSRSNGCSYEVNGNVLTITPFYPITAVGKYALKIPAGLITRVADGSEVTMNGEIEFEVSVPEGIDSVDAEVENDVIYDLSGRRIAEIVKPGIYIVNGKKVLVK